MAGADKDPSPKMDVSPRGRTPSPAGPPVDPAVASAEAQSAVLDFAVVGVGASAGGLEALEALFKRIQLDNMAFVVVQHLSPDHESNLTQVLGRSARMKVVTASDGSKVVKNVIYVLPPSAEVEIEDGILRLRPLVPAFGHGRHLIDQFLRSLAADQRGGAVGVVLSGGGSDGTLGLKAIKAEGGITFVQDPGTAIQPGMPRSALDSGSADFCLTPAEIADELMRISSHPYLAKVRPPRKANAAALQKVMVLLRQSAGVDFTQYKQSTIERRIERRMAVHRLEKLEDYLRYVEANPPELEVLYRDILIGVTNFFRDRGVFEEIKTTVLPRIFDRRSREQPVRIWSAACASGEEAYSLAICVLEYLGEKAAEYQVQIFGTDLDEDAIRAARHGLYPKNIELDVSPERLQRFFSRTDREYQISRNIREMVIFADQNVAKDPPFSRLDLICCRNVLIYMQQPLQKKVLRIFHYALNLDGFLVLGNAESVGDAADLFSVVDRKLKIFSKKNAPPAAVFDIISGHIPIPEPDRPATDARQPMISVHQLADRKVLEKYGPPGLIINDSLEVLQFRGKVGAYLDPTPGTATLSLLKLARPELLVELRQVVHRALTDNRPASSGKIHLKQGKDITTLVLDALPLEDAATRARTLLVLFRETSPIAVEAPRLKKGHGDPKVRELERELSTTKDYLQSVVEQLETANEEMKSSNEELESSNEELQSTNEELETSKEELQSTNEELATVNEELHNRMSELGRSNDDLQNILASTQVATLMVGTDLRIRRYSKSAEELFGLIPGDVGRPIGHLHMVTNTPDLEQIVSEAINGVTATEMEIKAGDGKGYLMRISPYLTGEHAIRGAMIELQRAVGGQDSRPAQRSAKAAE